MAESCAVALVLATSAGGVGRHVRSLADELVRRGHNVCVLGPAATQRVFDFTNGGARFVPLEIASGPRPAADARAVARLRGLVDDADVVHAHGLRAGLVAGLAVPRTTPLVVTWHNAVLGSRARRGVYGVLERVVARRADVTLAASSDLAARARSLGGRDVRFFPVAAPALPAPSRAPDEVRAELGAADRPLLVAVGRLHPQKAHDVLIDAVALLASARRLAGDPEPLLVVAGDGPDEASLADHIRRCAAPVRLLGRRTDVAELMAAASVVVLASRWEARALVAQEALCAGVPLVATAVGGVPELVQDAAELVPPGDPAALAAAIGRVLSDPVRAASMAAAGRRVAAGWPSQEEGIDHLVQLYLHLTSRRS